MKSILPQCKIRFLVFLLYNLLYVTYMLGYTSQSFYLGTLIVFCVMNLANIMQRRHGLITESLPEFRLGMGYVITFLIISLGIQLFNMDYESYLFSGLIRIALPIVNALLFVNSVDKEDFGYFFNALLLRFVFHFIWQNFANLNLAGLLSISWSESNSAMESSMAHDFMILEIYFLSKKENKKALISMIFCMLSMKRFSFILAPILFFFAKRLSVMDKPVKKAFLRGLKLVAIISPFLMFALYSQASQDFFRSAFNIDLNLKMGGRISIFDTLVNNIPYFNGYGSINAFLSDFVANRFGTTWNATLHNDFIRIYYETTIVGVIVLANNLVELSKRSYWNFIMIFYLLFVGITSHILNYFSVWITFYMIIMSTKVEIKDANEIDWRRE